MARIHYDILQIQPTASADEIQHAYRQLALRYHPDRNPGSDAASQMAAVNNAYRILHDSPDQRVRRDELTASIFAAARAVILRHGWTQSHAASNVSMFTIGNPSVRIALTDHLSNDSLLRYSRQHADLAAVLAIHLAGPIPPGSRLTVIDLMHAERHGAAIREGACKSLLSGFL
jgi:hypothetical protein